MYIMNVPVLSTAHIRPATSEFLTNEGSDNLGVVAAYDGGWFIFVGEREGLDTFDMLSEDLQKVLQWAFDNDHEWIRIDAHAGDIIEELPDYSGEW